MPLAGMPSQDWPSVIIYVEFGSAFPFNGGELIYVCILASSISRIYTYGSSWMRYFVPQNFWRQSFSPPSS